MQKDNSDNSERHMNPVKTVYQALDKAIGRLLERTDGETTVIVFADLGMGNNYSGEHLLESVLLRLEHNPLLRMWQRIYCGCVGYRRFRRLAQKVNNRLLKLRSAIQLPHNEISGAIRINLRGRERYGRVPDGDQFAEYCERLERELRDLRDPASGQPIVSEVIRPANSLQAHTRTTCQTEIEGFENGLYTPRLRHFCGSVTANAQGMSESGDSSGGGSDQQSRRHGVFLPTSQRKYCWR